MKKSYKHLSITDRRTIERMHKNGFSCKQMAVVIGCSLKTIYNELKRGECSLLNSELQEYTTYSADLAETKYQTGLRQKGQKAKLLQDPLLVDYIEYLIAEEGFSPQAVIYEIENQKLTFSVKVKSRNTIYSAIKYGLFPKLSLENLPRRGKHKRVRKRIKVIKAAPSGTSIEKRDPGILNRDTFGHWEMDCVVGTKFDKTALLVLTERKTRYEIIMKLKKQDSYEVVKALNRLEKKYKSDFYKVFQTITVDNGKEFADVSGMQKALYRVGNRTKIFYCHPRSPEERGSNENANLMIRRFLPKGTSFNGLTRSKLENISWWMNTYPRGIFNGSYSLQQYKTELLQIGCRFLD